MNLLRSCAVALAYSAAFLVGWWLLAVTIGPDVIALRLFPF